MPVIAVCGGESLLRRRFLRNVIDTKRKAGWRIDTIQGENKEALRDAIQQGGGFLSENTLVVVEHPEDMDLDMLKRHAGEKDPVTVLFLHVEGELDGRTKFGKYVKEVLASNLKSFPLPKEHEAGRVAVQFVLDEVKRHGMTIDQRSDNALLKALVLKVGTDLGVLSFEVQKMVLLARSGGGVAIEAAHIRGAMAPIGEASVVPLAEALGEKNQKRVYQQLEQIRRTTKDNPTMQVCGFLGASVTNWCRAAYLDKLGVADAAREMGGNPWVFEKFIQPAAKRWGREGTAKLLRVIAQAQRAVLNGSIDPWTVLASGLLEACSVSGRPH